MPARERDACQQEAEAPPGGGVEEVAGEEDEGLPQVRFGHQRPRDREHDREEDRELDGGEQQLRLSPRLHQPEGRITDGFPIAVFLPSA